MEPEKAIQVVVLILIQDKVNKSRTDFTKFPAMRLFRSQINPLLRMFGAWSAFFSENNADDTKNTSASQKLING